MRHDPDTDLGFRWHRWRMLAIHAGSGVEAPVEHLGGAFPRLFLIPVPGQHLSVRVDFQHGGKQRP